MEAKVTKHGAADTSAADQTPTTDCCRARRTRRHLCKTRFSLGRPSSHLHGRRHLRLDGELHQLDRLPHSPCTSLLSSCCTCLAGLPPLTARGSEAERRRGAHRTCSAAAQTALGALVHVAGVLLSCSPQQLLLSPPAPASAVLQHPKLLILIYIECWVSPGHLFCIPG